MKYLTVKKVRNVCLIPLLTLSLGSLAQADMDSTKASAASMSKEEMSGPHDMKQSMKSGMEHMQTMEMSGDMDKDFAMMMKMHHQNALEMAQMELHHGKSSEMKAMAKKIMAAQKKEIIQFDKWLAKHK